MWVKENTLDANLMDIQYTVKVFGKYFNIHVSLKMQFENNKRKFIICS